MLKSKIEGCQKHLQQHPCFSIGAHNKFMRLHLPVAPLCNIKCRYCDRRFDCVNESRPGVTSKLLKPMEALYKVSALIERNYKLTVVGIAGPGDPLANEETFETFRLINKEFPDLILCASTNGLSLNDRLEELVESGVTSLTVTINAINIETACKIYNWVKVSNKFLTGVQASEVLLKNQWEGLKKAIDLNLSVKVNTVFIPGINDHEIPLIASKAGSMGATLMNIIPLIPQAEFKTIKRPEHKEVIKMRTLCGSFISQMSHCGQCRADMYGKIGEDTDADLEVLYSKIGEEYCEVVN